MRDSPEDYLGDLGDHTENKSPEIGKGVHSERTCACGVAMRICESPACQDPVETQHVLWAVQQYDLLGRDQFLTQYSFNEEDVDLLVLNGKYYESKPILRAAYKLSTGRTLGPGDFGRGSHGSADVLRARGFELLNVSDWLEQMPRKVHNWQPEIPLYARDWQPPPGLQPPAVY